MKQTTSNTVDLDEQFATGIKYQLRDTVQSIVDTVEVNQLPLPDFDVILREWSYRCDSGYPTIGKKSDMIHLQEILSEMGIENPYTKIKMIEAPETSDSSLSSTTNPHKIFNATYLNDLYPKHSKSIMDVYRMYGSKSKTLDVFGTVTSLEDLIQVITQNINDPLFKALYTISSVSGKEGGEAETSGRGGLGKGEVLCVLLTNGGKSGGTAGTDLDSENGQVRAEIKAGKATNFKVPMAAARITKFESQAQLRKLYGMVESVKDTDEWVKFLDTIQQELGQDKMEIDDGVYFAKKPTPSNINFTEYKNLRKFFKGCHSYFYGSKSKTDDTVYIDIDSPSGDGALLQAKLKSPKSVAAIQSNGKVELDVFTKDVDAIRVFKLFEYHLKQHPFVVNATAFDETSLTDLQGLLKNKYIVFHEKVKGQLAAPILIENIGAPHNPMIIGYTLDQVIIKFS